MFRKTDYVRWFLTIVLLYFVFGETGIATTTLLLFAAVRFEIKDYLERIRPPNQCNEPDQSHNAAGATSTEGSL